MYQERETMRPALCGRRRGKGGGGLVGSMRLFVLGGHGGAPDPLFAQAVAGSGFGDEQIEALVRL